MHLIWPALVYHLTFLIYFWQPLIIIINFSRRCCCSSLHCHFDGPTEKKPGWNACYSFTILRRLCWWVSHGICMRNMLEIIMMKNGQVQIFMASNHQRPYDKRDGKGVRSISKMTHLKAHINNCFNIRPYRGMFLSLFLSFSRSLCVHSMLLFSLRWKALFRWLATVSLLRPRWLDEITLVGRRELQMMLSILLLSTKRIELFLAQKKRITVYRSAKTILQRNT